MSEERSSAAAVGPEAAPKTSGAPPGGTLPPAGQPNEATALPSPSRQFTLQYLIAALKKPSN
jgi:hypothetical protein